VVEQVREKEREDQLRNGRNQEDPERVEERIPESSVGEELLKVREAYEGLLSNGIPVEQRDVEREEEGKKSEDDEDDEDRRDVRVGSDPLRERVTDPRGFLNRDFDLFVRVSGCGR
jgi:hypothetical protein